MVTTRHDEVISSAGGIGAGRIATS